MGNRKTIALTALALGLCGTSAAVALASSTLPHPWVSAGIASLTCAALLGVGLYAWRRGGQGRFGQILFATGLCWFLASLSNSDVALLYSVGRVFVWVFEAALIYALASYPTGRLETRGARLLAAAAATLVAVLYVPSIPFLHQFPLPTPFTGCVEACPSNAFYAGTEPGLIGSFVKPLREVLTCIAYAAATGLIAVWLRDAGHNLKRTLVPVLGAALLRFAAAAVFVGLRRAGAGTQALEAAGMVTSLTVPVTALGFLVGLLQWRIYSAGALAELTTGLGALKGPAETEELLVDSLADPAVELYYSPDGDGWLDAAGHPHAGPSASGRTIVAEDRAESGLRVGIVCDRGFRDYPGFLGAVTSCVLSGLERQRLDAALSASLESVAASRKRLAGAADDARRKIERDLHDGAQQQLVALRVKLELAREALDGHGDGAAELVAGLGPEVDEIIEEVRSLARGIYPPLLASSGLEDALRAAGRRSQLPVTVRAAELGRLPSETESAVYFCCLEAMQNAAKHAAGATGIAIELDGGEGLRFEVADDGDGFDPGLVVEGSGITGMRDRLAAVGGGLRVDSAPGAGTRVRGRIDAG